MHLCQMAESFRKEMLNCLFLYLNGEIYTSLYPLDARDPDPPQLGFHKPP
jgi:hypothetical protein